MATQVVARIGDLSSHGGAAIISATSTHVRISGTQVAVVGDTAAFPDGSGHTLTSPSTGSALVRIKGNALHRNGDSRECGGTTVGSQTFVRAE